MSNKKKRSSIKKRIKRSKHFSSILLISMLLLIISCSVWIATARVNKRIAEGEQIRIELAGQIEEEKKQQEVIQDKIDYLKSDEYIEDIARDKLGLIFENEIIFKKQKK